MAHDGEHSDGNGNDDRLWLGRPVLDKAHVNDLERQAAIHEFDSKLPRPEAEAQAYSGYQKRQHQEAAAHHLLGMKAGLALGAPDDARRHSLLYDLHLQKLGHAATAGGAVPADIDRITSELAHRDGGTGLYGFKPHGADAWVMDAGPSDWQAQKSVRELLDLAKADGPVLAKLESEAQGDGEASSPSGYRPGGCGVCGQRSCNCREKSMQKGDVLEFRRPAAAPREKTSGRDAEVIPISRGKKPECSDGFCSNPRAPGSKFCSNHTGATPANKGEVGMGKDKEMSKAIGAFAFSETSGSDGEPLCKLCKKGKGLCKCSGGFAKSEAELSAEEKSKGYKNCSGCGKKMNPVDAFAGMGPIEDSHAPVCMGCAKKNHAKVMGKAEAPLGKSFMPPKGTLPQGLPVANAHDSRDLYPEAMTGHPEAGDPFRPVDNSEIGQSCRECGEVKPVVSYTGYGDGPDVICPECWVQGLKFHGVTARQDRNRERKDGAERQRQAVEAQRKASIVSKLNGLPGVAKSEGSAEAPPCPGCGSESGGEHMGDLGRLSHFRCRHCGMDFSHAKEKDEDLSKAEMCSRCGCRSCICGLGVFQKSEQGLGVRDRLQRLHKAAFLLENLRKLNGLQGKGNG